MLFLHFVSWFLKWQSRANHTPTDRDISFSGRERERERGQMQNPPLPISAEWGIGWAMLPPERTGIFSPVLKLPCAGKITNTQEHKHPEPPCEILPLASQYKFWRCPQRTQDLILDVWIDGLKIELNIYHVYLTTGLEDPKRFSDSILQQLKYLALLLFPREIRGEPFPSQLACVLVPVRHHVMGWITGIVVTEESTYVCKQSYPSPAEHGQVYAGQIMAESRSCTGSRKNPNLMLKNSQRGKIFGSLRSSSDAPTSR